MQRIRLLRHHNIQPYIVFDGGPLPAKQGTESGRKQRREENLAKAKLLAAEGKHSQAREFYAKCVDVTPQMAYQFIKVASMQKDIPDVNPDTSLGPPSGRNTIRGCTLRSGCSNGLLGTHRTCGWHYYRGFRPTSVWMPQRLVQIRFRCEHGHQYKQSGFQLCDDSGRGDFSRRMDGYPISCYGHP